MDPLSELLGGVRAEGAVFADAVLKAPWVLYFDDRAPLTMITMTRGGVLLLSDGGELELEGGQTAVVRGDEPFRLADTAASADRPHAEYWITCFDTQTCDPGRRPQGAHGDPDATSIFVGAYRGTRPRHRRLLRALPPTLVVDEDGAEIWKWLEACAADFAERRPGAQALIDRLFDWSLVCALRTWFEQEGPAAPGWFRGFADTVVGPALEAVHSDPSEPWTVSSLAAASGVSRALFAKRFTEIMGEPPLSYLTELRMEHAEELLADPNTTVARVARAVGYADPFGFSAAFKRRRGQSPSEFRTACLSADPTGAPEAPAAPPLSPRPRRRSERR